MKIEDQRIQSSETSPELMDASERKGRSSSDENDSLPLEELVTSSSSACSFMGARSPWSNS